MSRTDLRSAVAKVRRFSRFYTRRVGVLQEAFMDSALSLPEGRVVYEIAQRQQASARDLVTDLDLDPGYLSRLLKGLEGRGFLRRVVSRQDARQHLLTLTPAGHREYDKIDQRAQSEVEDLLAPLAPGQRTNLVHALSTVERLMSGQTHAANVTFRDLRPGDIGLVISRHGALYTEEYGWDQSFEAMVAKVAGEFIDNLKPDKERAWIAEIEGRVVGSVFLVQKSDDVAKLRLLYVEPDARGHRIGRRLVDKCIVHARSCGYRRITLWTNDILTAARGIYQSCGFALVHSEPHHSFGKDLVGETWELDL